MSWNRLQIQLGDKSISKLHWLLVPAKAILIWIQIKKRTKNCLLFKTPFVADLNIVQGENVQKNKEKYQKNTSHGQKNNITIRVKLFEILAVVMLFSIVTILVPISAFEQSHPQIVTLSKTLADTIYKESQRCLITAHQQQLFIGNNDFKCFFFGTIQEHLISMLKFRKREMMCNHFL